MFIFNLFLLLYVYVYIYIYVYVVCIYMFIFTNIYIFLKYLDFKFKKIPPDFVPFTEEILNCKLHSCEMFRQIYLPTVPIWTHFD